MQTEKTHETETSALDLYEHPGHLLRRAQQISVSMFYDEMGSELTPVQYAVLSRLAGRALAAHSRLAVTLRADPVGGVRVSRAVALRRAG